MEKILQVKSDLDKKLVNEGLSNNQQTMLNEINRRLNEAPVSYDGPERMEPGIERQINQRQTPYAENPMLPQDGDRDFVELITSQRFKDSVEKVRRFLGDTRVIQGNNPMMGSSMFYLGKKRSKHQPLYCELYGTDADGYGLTIDFTETPSTLQDVYEAGVLEGKVKQLLFSFNNVEIVGIEADEIELATGEDE